MKVRTLRVDYQLLAKSLNNIGVENVLYIVPQYIYEGTLFVIVYKKED